MKIKRILESSNKSPTRHNKFVENNFEKVEKEIIEAAQKLEKSNVSFCIMACNTAHLFFNKITKEITPNLPWLHIADPTALAIKEKGLTKVGLLGTKLTMSNSKILIDRLCQHKLEVVAPEEEKIKQRLEDIISKEIDSGIFKNESKQFYIEVVNILHKLGCQGIVLGCTEIGLLLKQEDVSSIPLFDTGFYHTHATSNIQLGLKSITSYFPPND